ncbi:uncharacterized protein LOC105838019 [Monomorium pharaonis]|uniref:uncharacterized protein LOC105838019 n=1 Tax=Monomorium pharaonis TaxID=307658 RepID=UPI001746120A|nr:uncharacterized protein LOC105838019 [Monomorium pharaonis]
MRKATNRWWQLRASRHWDFFVLYKRLRGKKKKRCFEFVRTFKIVEKEENACYDDRYMIKMKKRGSKENKDSKSCQSGNNAIDKTDSGDLSDDENQGFGNWLRSGSGVEMMRLFVIANSILVFVTMAWPNMRESFYIIKDYFVGEEE